MDNGAIAIREALPTFGGAEIERAMQFGDLAKMTDEERARYYLAVCASTGLNPLTRPLTLMRNKAGELFFYAGKGACEQLRKRDHISLRIASRERDGDNYTVVVAALTPSGRTEESMAVVAIKGLSGQALGDAMMRCETKAKNRATLSIAGLGFSAVEDADPRGSAVRFNPQTGEIQEPRGAIEARLEVKTLQEHVADLYGDVPATDPIDAVRSTEVGIMIDTLLMSGGVNSEADQRTAWERWHAYYRGFTPAVLGMIRDTLTQRLQERDTEEPVDALPVGGGS